MPRERKHPDIWKQWESDLLKAMLEKGDKSWGEIARAIGRHTHACSNRAARLGLKYKYTGVGKIKPYLGPDVMPKKASGELRHINGQLVDYGMGHGVWA